MVHRFPPKDVIVQVNVTHSHDMRYVQIKSIPTALEYDPDLASLQQTELLAIFHMLFIVAGCDYIIILF